MQKQMKLLLLAYVAVAFLLSSNYVCGCFESEKQVLLHFNQSRSVIDHDDDPMSSWVGDDCCSWDRVQCNYNGHVIELNLVDSSLKGILLENIGNLTFLTYLALSYNQLNGSLPESLCQLSKLEVLDVRYNQLRTIPKCIGGLSNLTYLYLDSNSWEGSISEQHLVNLTSLARLYISSKSNLVFDVNSEWIPPFQLELLSMNSVNVGPGFPSWLLTQTRISYFIMQNTSISDAIPIDWFANLLSRAYVVDLSNNDNNLPLPSFIPTSNNMLELFLSNNHLSSDFPAYICNFTSLRRLVLSNCNISGELPRCLRNLTVLATLNVMNNNLSGDIPDFLGSLGFLTYLNFHNNRFEGKLPPSIQNLTYLRVFDVGYNNLRDILPLWTGEQLRNLSVLVLRANHFYGSIPKQFCIYSSIQVLNLAENHITGKLPPCFYNLTAITSDEDDILNVDYGEMIIDNAKGYELEYTSTLKYLFSIDLSNNNISGEIPEELMDIRQLLNLNLAGNKLSGRIPETIGKMEQLEYLDLSRNKLSGPIPKSLSELKYLIHLNLSFNDLSGKIPTGNQLQVLDNPSSIYAGNNQLCGPPTPKLCPGDPEQHEGHDYKKVDSNSGSDEDDEHVWFYAGIGPGVLVGFLGFCGSLHLIKSWRYTFFHYVEKVFDRVALFIALSRKKFNSKQIYIKH